MPVSERDWAKEPLPAEQDRDQFSKNTVEGLDEWELTMTGDGYRARKADPSPTLGWIDVLFWVVILSLIRLAGG